MEEDNTEVQNQMLSGCNGIVSVYASDSGKLTLDKAAHSASILTLSFSPNSKHLVSSAQDKILHVFAWPDMANRYDIEFAKPIKVSYIELHSINFWPRSEGFRATI